MGNLWPKPIKNRNQLKSYFLDNLRLFLLRGLDAYLSDEWYTKGNTAQHHFFFVPYSLGTLSFGEKKLYPHARTTSIVATNLELNLSTDDKHP